MKVRSLTIVINGDDALHFTAYDDTIECRLISAKLYGGYAVHATALLRDCGLIEPKNFVIRREREDPTLIRIGKTTFHSGNDHNARIVLDFIGDAEQAFVERAAAGEGTSP